MRILKPGRVPISADRSLKQKSRSKLRLFLTLMIKVLNLCRGSILLSGISDLRQVVGKVKSYDPDNQILTLIDIEGYLHEGEMINNRFGTNPSLM